MSEYHGGCNGQNCKLYLCIFSNRIQPVGPLCYFLYKGAMLEKEREQIRELMKIYLAH